jgi:hypothetical protein
MNVALAISYILESTMKVSTACKMVMKFKSQGRPQCPVILL